MKHDTITGRSRGKSIPSKILASTWTILFVFSCGAQKVPDDSALQQYAKDTLREYAQELRWHVHWSNYSAPDELAGTEEAVRFGIVDREMLAFCVRAWDRCAVASWDSMARQRLFHTEMIQANCGRDCISERIGTLLRDRAQRVSPSRFDQSGAPPDQKTPKSFSFDAFNPPGPDAQGRLQITDLQVEWRVPALNNWQLQPPASNEDTRHLADAAEAFVNQGDGGLCTGEARIVLPSLKHSDPIAAVLISYPGCRDSQVALFARSGRDVKWIYTRSLHNPREVRYFETKILDSAASSTGRKGDT